MDNEEINVDQPEQRWYIDVEWYQANNRSFVTLAQTCLCSKCKKRLQKKQLVMSAPEIITNIQDCCAKEPEFINSELPILESVFRLFLANGNQPLSLEEIENQLGEKRRGDIYRTSVNSLPRLFSSDQYYGFRQAEI